jgi:hypothetical protein
MGRKGQDKAVILAEPGQIVDDMPTQRVAGGALAE